MLGLLSSSRAAEAGADSTVYGRLYTQGTVYSTTLSSGSTPTTTSGSLSPADAAHFHVGELAQVWLDCGALRAASSNLCGSDLTQAAVAVDIMIGSLDPVSGAITWYMNTDGYPSLPVAPLAGARFDSVLYGPGNLSVDSSSRTYVADTWNNRIAVFDASGNPLYTIGQYGSVYHVSNDPSSSLWGYPVASSDAHADCLDVFGGTHPSGDAGFSACPDDPAQLLGEFNYPGDVAVASNADGTVTLVIADSGNHRIQVLTTDATATAGACPASDVVASNGSCFTASSLGTWGLDLGATPPVGEMSFPNGVAVSATGRIAVADTDNSRIQVFDPSAAGTVVASNGTKFSAFTFGHFGESSAGSVSALELNYPLDVAIDGTTDRIIVADSANNQVKVYSASGDEVDLLGGESGSDPGSFSYPWGVGAADTSGNLLVADTFNQRMQQLTRVDTTYSADSSVRFPAIHSPVGVASTPAGGFMATEFEFHQIVRLAPLGLTVTSAALSSAAPTAGSQVQATFTVQNSGQIPLTNVQPQVTGVTTVTCSTGGDSAAVDLAIDGTHTFTLCFTAGISNIPMSLDVSATGWSDTMLVTAASSALTLTPAPSPEPGVSVSATASPTRVQVNATVVVTVTVSNVGNTALTGLTLTPGSIAGLTLDTTRSESLASTLAANAVATVKLTFLATQVEPTQQLSVQVGANETDSNNVQVHGDASASIEVVSDVDPPVVSAALSSATNANGWSQIEPATLTIVATDAGTGLASISYRASTNEQGGTTFSGQASGQLIGSFQGHGQGGSVVAFWAEDVAGNASLNDRVPRPGESVVSFCKRLPAQCVTLQIDTLPPLLLERSNEIRIADDNSSVTVPFDATDSQSGVWKVEMTNTQAGGVLKMNADSNTSGALTLTSEGSSVYGEVTVTDYAGWQSTFHLPFQGANRPVIRLDQHPPEAFNRVDPTALGSRCSATASDGTAFTYWCTNKVYGTDNLPGLTSDAFAPVSVTPTRWGGDDGEGEDDHEDFGGNAELHTYSFTDEYVPPPGTPGVKPLQNPNRVTLVEKVRQDGNEARVRVMSYQYTTGTVAGPVIVPDWAYKKYEWARNRDGSLKTLNQKFELHKGHDRWQVLANYDGKKDITVVRELGPDPGKRVIYSGLVLLRMTTHAGELRIEYDGTLYTGSTDGIDDDHSDSPGSGGGQGTTSGGDNGNSGSGADSGTSGDHSSSGDSSSGSADSSNQHDGSGNSGPGASNGNNDHHDDGSNYYAPVGGSGSSSGSGSGASGASGNGGSSNGGGSSSSGASNTGGNGNANAGDSNAGGNGNGSGNGNGNSASNAGGNGNGSGNGNGNSSAGSNSSSSTDDGSSGSNSKGNESRDSVDNGSSSNSNSSSSSSSTSSESSDSKGKSDDSKKSDDQDQKDKEDHTPPVLTLPGSLSAVATSANGATVTYSTTAVDAVSGSRPVQCAYASGSLFPVGTTPVFCSALDAAGNVASGTFTVTVTAPATTSDNGNNGNGNGNNGDNGNGKKS